METFLIYSFTSQYFFCCTQVFACLWRPLLFQFLLILPKFIFIYLACFYLYLYLLVLWRRSNITTIDVVLLLHLPKFIKLRNVKIIGDNTWPTNFGICIELISRNIEGYLSFDDYTLLVYSSRTSACIQKPHGFKQRSWPTTCHFWPTKIVKKK
jgi:hypothetical protein